MESLHNTNKKIYLPTFFLPTYLYIPTYTYLPTYLPTYQPTYLPSNLPIFLPPTNQYFSRRPWSLNINGCGEQGLKLLIPESLIFSSISDNEKGIFFPQSLTTRKVFFLASLFAVQNIINME